MTKTTILNEIKALSVTEQKEVVDSVSQSLKEHEETLKKTELKKKLSELVDKGELTYAYYDYSYTPKLLPGIRNFFLF